MVSKGYFCICTVDNVLKISGGVPKAKDYQMLRTLHCIHFKDMPEELLAELPKIIQRVVESPEFALEIDVSVVNATPLSDRNLSWWK
jgi:hypothetical protein